jgi:alkanesulfonate monooxygenase
LPAVPDSLLPGLLLAGQSDAARRVCNAVGAIGMQMLKPELERAVAGVSGIHFGIVTRATEDQAWQAAHALFPEDELGRAILEISMKNTDSAWKRQMKAACDDELTANSNYWLAPFRAFKADCPYFVGDYARVSDLLVGLIRNGIEVFILDVPASEEEFYHVDAAFKMASGRLSYNSPEILGAFAEPSVRSI